MLQGIPWRSSGLDAVFSPPMSHVPSLVGELRSYKLCGATNQIKINKQISMLQYSTYCSRTSVASINTFRNQGNKSDSDRALDSREWWQGLQQTWEDLLSLKEGVTAQPQPAVVPSDNHDLTSNGPFHASSI